MEGSAVIAISAPQYSQVPYGGGIDEEIGAARCSGGLETVWRRGREGSCVNVAYAEFKYGALPVSGRCFIGCFSKGSTRTLYLSPLLLAVRLIVMADTSKLMWQREIENRLTSPLNQVGVTRQASLSGDRYELIAKRPEVLS
jgi:hypothetical protein